MKIHLKRSFFIRLAVIVVVLAIAVTMFFIGKEHTVLIDNQSRNGHKALDYFEFSVDGSAMLDMAPMMRELVNVTGQKHQVKLQYKNEDGKMMAVAFEITIPLMQDMVLLSVPTFMADMSQSQSVWLEPYEVAPSAPTEEDNTVILDDMASFSSL